MSDITIDVLDQKGKKTSSAHLPTTVFGRAVNVPLIHQVVVAQLAAARQGTHATKTRGEVRGGGIKPWRQKGTGRARQGSRRSPQWAGGGTVFGPQPRSYAQRTPKKMIAQALCSVLSDRVADGRLFVVDSIVSDDIPSTKKALKTLSGIGEYTTAMVVLHRDEDVAWLSLRNVVNVHAIAVDQLNAYDVVSNQVVVFTLSALEEFITRYGATNDVAAMVEEAHDEEAAPPVEPKTAKVKAKTTEENVVLDPIEAEEVPAVGDETVAEADQLEAPVDEADTADVKKGKK